MKWPGAAARPLALHFESPAAHSPLDVFEPLQDHPGACLLHSGIVHPGAQMGAPWQGGLFRELRERGITPWISAGRWSLLFEEPDFYLRARGGEVERLRADGEVEERRVMPALVAVEGVLATGPRAPVPGLPFCAGLVGCLSYELGWQHDRVRVPPPVARGPHPPTPDLLLAAYSAACLLDHERGVYHVVSCGWEDGPGGRAAIQARLERWRERLRAPTRRASLPSPPTCVRPLTADLSAGEYLDKVRRVKEHIAQGDIYQANFTHRFVLDSPPDPWRTWRTLAHSSPAPHAAYLRLPGLTVASASPERLLRVEGRHLLSQPIKGTRRRDPDPSRDRALARELIHSEKDRAELTMIVDLVRNDLGRVAQVGSVHPLTVGELEPLPTVFHRVASVEATLKVGATPLDAVRALFPGGSITGAPKLRAMEILAELEVTQRGVYTGSIGYFDTSGDLDLNIAIRTLVFSGGVASFHVGGGIVWDSDPEAELDETHVKGRALANALGATLG